QGARARLKPQRALSFAPRDARRPLIELALDHLQGRAFDVDYAPEHTVAIAAAGDLHAVASTAARGFAGPTFAGSRCNSAHAFFQRIFCRSSSDNFKPSVKSWRTASLPPKLLP